MQEPLGHGCCAVGRQCALRVGRAAWWQAYGRATNHGKALSAPAAPRNMQQHAPLIGQQMVGQW